MKQYISEDYKLLKIMSVELVLRETGTNTAESYIKSEDILYFRPDLPLIFSQFIVETLRDCMFLEKLHKRGHIFF